MAGPTISRGDIYGGEEGVYSATAEASGAVTGGLAPATWALIFLGVLVAIRLIWEGAD